MKQIADEPPPFLKTWPRVYLLVLCELICVIALFAWFTAAFRS